MCTIIRYINTRVDEKMVGWIGSPGERSIGWLGQKLLDKIGARRRIRRLPDRSLAAGCGGRSAGPPGA